MKVEDLESCWYRMLEALSQKGLKRIVQSQIARCHPGKQGKNPYNGGKDRDMRSVDEHNPGYYTAPGYWPNQDGWENKKGDACRHREPHHVKKSGSSRSLQLYRGHR